MAVGGLFRFAHRALFAKPTPDRQLLKLIKATPVRRVVEVGVDSLAVTEALLAAVVKQSAGEAIRYTALDPFDQRPPGREALPLMEAYRRLVPLGAKVRFAPGDPTAGIAAEANSLENTDLLLLSAEATDAALGSAWYFVPRMCHPGTLVVRRLPAGGAENGEAWETVPLTRVAQLAAPPLRKAA